MMIIMKNNNNNNNNINISTRNDISVDGYY